jgi:hypothetical protein
MSKCPKLVSAALCKHVKSELGLSQSHKYSPSIFSLPEHSVKYPPGHGYAAGSSEVVELQCPAVQVTVGSL